ncbi:MAG: hypothetical protein HRT87_06755 [Legionellales bacterium]|nr:hypothetical protein [Legionellales bacterium]
MFSTKKIVFSFRNVPSYWVFQYYLNLSEPLTGQAIKIKSIWTNEKTPSMCIYVDTDRHEYVFKDFSSGKQGDKITLVMYMFNIPYSQACNKMVEDYNKNKENIKTLNELKADARWEVDFIQYRDWNKKDAEYWLKYKIDSKSLDRYNVKPVEYYKISKTSHNGEISNLIIKNGYLYAFLDKNNEAYKIYQPYNKKAKFFKLKAYVQGLDQLKYDQPYLVIASSMKDLLSLNKFNYNIECIAPDSENSAIKPYIIKNLRERYTKIIVLFDNDEGGRKGIAKYKELYDIDGVFLDMKKDLSDSVKDHGLDEVHKLLAPLFKKCIYGK